MKGIEKSLKLARKLGIPDDAESVIIFGESSHWDPNWLMTSKEYYRFRIKKILDQAIHELEAEPRRVFGIECVFFLKMFWERNPDKTESIRRLVNERRLRFTGCGITTPDVTIPDTEAIIRDYLLGQEWLRENRMQQEPRLAYLPDDFGVSPALPSILNSLGITQAAISRIDGCRFPGSDYVRSSYFPRPGSTAELLLRNLKCMDVIWIGPDSSSVLLHWNPFTYGQGDMLTARGLAKLMGLLIGVPDRSLRNISRKIDTYVRQLSPLVRTRYMFCPIGADFNAPIPGLVGLLDSYNRAVYPMKGVYAINAGLDDYLDLVSCHKELLPELSLDPNPYWTGFYSARPEMKQRCRKIVRDLVAAEMLLATSEDISAVKLIEELKPAWETAAVSNHHDFITGTSPDRVWEKEQKPWLIESQNIIDKVMPHALSMCPVEARDVTVPGSLVWKIEHGVLHVESSHYIIEVSEALGGCITKWVIPHSTDNMMAGPGNDAVIYTDSGGLWRMGHEYVGGNFRAKQRASNFRAELNADERDGVLHVVIQSWLNGRDLLREMWFRNDSPFVRMRLLGSADKRRTVTCRFSTKFRPFTIEMDVPGGIVSRPLCKVYDPTFWAASWFAHVRDIPTGAGMAVFMAGPASISANRNGEVEWVALRNAPRERAFGFLPFASHPAYGLDDSEHPFDYAIGFTREGDWQRNSLPAISRKIFRKTWIDPHWSDPEDRAEGVVMVPENVRVLALKRAQRGEGLILRLQSFGPKEALIGLTGRQVKKAVLCDARERDIKDLSIDSEALTVPFTASIATVRLFL